VGFLQAYHHTMLLLPPVISHGISVFGDSDTDEYMNKLMNDCDGAKPLEEWSIFYCGGSNAIKKDLKKISHCYGIDLAMENFDW